MKAAIWTDRERAQLLQLRQAGHKHAEIARKLGRTTNAVAQALSALSATRPRPPRNLPALPPFVRDHHARGLSDAEIAKHWNASHPDDGITRQRVSNTRQQLGLPSNIRSQHQRQRRAEQLAASGVPLAERRQQASEAFAERHGWTRELAPSEVLVLHQIYEHGPANYAQLGAVLGLTRKSLSRAVQRLRKRCMLVALAGGGCIPTVFAVPPFVRRSASA